MEAEELADEEGSEDVKRTWSSLKGGWGKRATDWANFRGQYPLPVCQCLQNLRIP